MGKWLALTVVVLAAAGCGGEHLRTVKSLRACVGEHLAKGAAGRVFESTVDGVTTITYAQRDGETLVSVFPSVGAAQDAMDAEARIGDAHDQRVGNVTYGGGGSATAAVEACLR
jgi:hypothetical protein